MQIHEQVDQAHTVQTPSEPDLSDPVLSVSGLTGGYGGNAIFADVEFAVRQREILCLVGPSGVGKTTLLRSLSGLQRPMAGTVKFQGQSFRTTPPHLSIVFQDYARSLLPWMTTLDNVALPLRVEGVAKSVRRERAHEALVAVGLAGASSKYPWQLSGGMQQRVAIARALASDPALILMDEPFASVDAQTRFELEDLTLQICADRNLSVLLVTHDIDEAVYLGDTVLVLAGKPASITDTFSIPFEGPREQLATRADPRFTTLRTDVFLKIRAAKALH